MKRRKVTEILIETVETIVIRRSPTAAQLTAWCALCGQTVTLLAPDEAATRTGASTRTIFRWVEAGQLHFLEAADGRLWLCDNSVRQVTATGSPEQTSNTKET